MGGRLRIICIIGLTLCCAFVSADEYGELQYWASIASFDRADEAQQFVTRIELELGDRFTVIERDTVNGRYYRVVTGPYLSRQLAQDRVRGAQAAGYVDAWVWVDRVVATQLTSYQPPGGTSSQTSTATPPPSPPTATKVLPTLVDQAPDGYQLNRLRRE